MSFEVARKVADAILFEGYLLYPYRASSQKNQLRWQFGVLVPPQYHAAEASERCYAQTECLVESGTGARVQIRLRCLQVHARGGAELDEGEVREVEAVASLTELLGCEQVLPFEFSGAVSGRLVLAAERLDGPYGVVKLHVRVENTSPWNQPSAGRNEAVRHSLVAAHTLLAITDGVFISLLDPPEWARTAAAACVNEGTWPVLVGEPEQRDLMLSSPIILYDYPQIAPESPGDLFDATEIDEILTLRTMALTDDEKREARESDPRAAALLDRVDDMPAEILERLHGAVRYLGARPSFERAGHGRASEPEPSVPWWDPGADTSVSPETDSLFIGESIVAKGSRVRLTPGQRRADAQDMFLVDRTARVEGVFLDVDGEQYLAVTLEDDPGADLYQAQGRFLYFRPDEVEPLRPDA